MLACDLLKLTLLAVVESAAIRLFVHFQRRIRDDFVLARLLACMIALLVVRFAEFFSAAAARSWQEVFLLAEAAVFAEICEIHDEALTVTETGQS